MKCKSIQPKVVEFIQPSCRSIQPRLYKLHPTQKITKPIQTKVTNFIQSCWLSSNQVEHSSIMGGAKSPFFFPFLLLLFFFFVVVVVAFVSEELFWIVSFDFCQFPFLVFCFVAVKNPFFFFSLLGKKKKKKNPFCIRICCEQREEEEEEEGVGGGGRDHDVLVWFWGFLSKFSMYSPLLLHLCVLRRFHWLWFVGFLLVFFSRLESEFSSVLDLSICAYFFLLLLLLLSSSSLFLVKSEIRLDFFLFWLWKI